MLDTMARELMQPSMVVVSSPCRFIMPRGFSKNFFLGVMTPKWDICPMLNEFNTSSIFVTAFSPFLSSIAMVVFVVLPPELYTEVEVCGGKLIF